MSKSKKIVAALGVAAVLGGSFIPLSSYAANNSTQNGTVTVTVADAIELTVTNEAAGIAMEANQVKDSTESGNGMIHKLVVKTNSATGYNIAIKDTDSDTNLKTSSGATIPAASGVLAVDNGGWGYKVENDTVAGSVTNTGWTAVTTSDVNIRTHEAAATAQYTETTYVRFGVATKADQAAGTYTDTVTYTATVRN